MSKPKGESVQELDTARALYPRVSEIIGKQTERDMRAIPIDTLANACIRGTKVHDYCEAYIKGLFMPEIEPEYQPYVGAFIAWAEDNIHQLLYSGVRLYDDTLRFSGEYDCIVVLKGSKQIALLDLKTSANASKSWPIQLAAYKHLCDVNGYDVESVMNIHLKKTKLATVKVVEIPNKNLMPSWQIFTSALACYDYFDRKEG